MTKYEKRQIVLANKIPFHVFTKIPNKRSLIRCLFKMRHANHDIHRSAFYYKETNLVHCFVCGQTWTPVSFLAEKSGRSKLEVAGYLLKKYSISVNEKAPDTKAERLLGKIQKLKEDKKEQIWDEMRAEYSLNPDYVGIVNFINLMKSEEDSCGVDLYMVTLRDAQAIKTLIDGREQI